MNKTLEKDKNQIADLLKNATNQAQDFIKNIDERFTTSRQTTHKDIEKLNNKGVELVFGQMVKLVQLVN